MYLADRTSLYELRKRVFDEIAPVRLVLKLALQCRPPLPTSVTPCESTLVCCTVAFDPVKKPPLNRPPASTGRHKF